MKYTFIDSDVFLRSIRYPRDARMAANETFLNKVRQKKIRAATSIFNVVEVCGILSFNLDTKTLLGLYGDFARHFGVKIFLSTHNDGQVRYDIAEIMEQIMRKQSLGDAQIATVVSSFASQISRFVSWNAVHFQGKIPAPVFTPEELN